MYDPFPQKNFNPRPPCGGRHLLFRKFFFYAVISIHAPRVGGDFSPRRTRLLCLHFNPRPPCGGRLDSGICSNTEKSFQSTPPVWGATDDLFRLGAVKGISIHAPRVGGDLQLNCTTVKHCCISIHAPRVGGDCSSRVSSVASKHFNPRPPCGGRRDDAQVASMIAEFQSTPPVWGATVSMNTGRGNLDAFQSTPPVWGATAS